MKGLIVFTLRVIEDYTSVQFTVKLCTQQLQEQTHNQVKLYHQNMQ